MDFYREGVYCFSGPMISLTPGTGRSGIQDMKRDFKTFRFHYPLDRLLTWGDVFVFFGVATIIYIGVRLALFAPTVVTGPKIFLNFRFLPYYAGLSMFRMTVAYSLSLVFTLFYGHIAAYNRNAEQVMMPVLDVLQSVPILSFLPVTLLGLNAFLPERIAAEAASIVLIFTCQVWNMTFSWYQSLTTIPNELREASNVFRYNWWMRFKVLELPFSAIGLIWNSMMSWAGGWFFLMAAEMFSVGERDFRLPGLGAYLSEAAGRGDIQALFWGIVTLALLIVLLDQLVWRPLLTWSERFKIEMVETDYPTTSWLYDVLCSSRVAEAWGILWRVVSERLDGFMARHWPLMEDARVDRPPRAWLKYFLGGLLALFLLSGAWRVVVTLLSVPLTQWQAVFWGLLATTLRVLAALAIAFVWTVPFGVAVGMNPRLARWLQPVVQMIASFPATALFPLFVLVLVHLAGGLNLAAVLLMLAGSQWYLLFNVIAGAAAIPQDLKYTTSLLQLNRRQRWRVLILPALFPYLVTGAITAGGGAWNASIIAEYIEFGGHTLRTTGLGSLISSATATGDYPLLLAATLIMILAVVLFNRLFWRRLYGLAERRYRME